MLEEKRVLCVIPARGGSKGLPGKNIKRLAGKPLIAYTIEQALESRYIDRVIVSTEDDRIGGVSRKFGAEVPFKRPVELAGDDSSVIDVLLHAVGWMERVEGSSFDMLVLLHATTPLRLARDIDACIEMLVEEDADNVFSVSESHRNPYFNMVEIDAGGRVRKVKDGGYATRQAAPKVFDMNASIYVWWTDLLKEKKRTFLDGSRVYKMPKERSVDIDDAVDFLVAEALLRGGDAGKS